MIMKSDRKKLKLCKVIKGRESWKERAKEYQFEKRRCQDKIRSLEKKLERKELEINNLEDELNSLKKNISTNIDNGNSSLILVNIHVFSLFLFKFGIVSFRAIPRIIEVFSYFFKLPIKKYHFTSVINWSLKVGLYKLQSSKQSSERWTAIMDASIKLGKKKLLLILKVRSSIMSKRNK